VFWDLEKDMVVPEHHHVGEQIMLVFEGEFEFMVDGDKQVYAGDIVPIAPDISHSGRALSPCMPMDIFSTAREEYS